MEESPPPLISVVAFNFVLDKAFTYLKCYGMGQGVDVLNLKDKLLKRMGEIQAVSDYIGYLEIKERSTAYCTWLWPLRDAIEETEDAVDSIAYYECEGATKAQKAQHKVQHPKSKFVKGKDIGAANSVPRICISRLRNAVLDLDEVAEDAYLHCHHEIRHTFENNRESIDNLLIGRFIEKEEIVSWLKQPESVRTSQGLSVFAIYGKGGMGKTALAQLAYRDEEVLECFDTIIWLQFTKNFDAEIMTRIILESVANWRFSYDTLEDLQKILISELSAKKFLLILDGAKDGERIDEWEKLVAPLRNGQRESRILLTTQELSVVNTFAELTGTKPDLLHLNGLGYDDSLVLFRTYAFAGLGPEIYAVVSPGISEESISLVIKRTVERFEASPLLIKALGGYLGDNMSSDHLDEIIMLLGHDEYRGDINRLLKLCYYGLPTHIQACFRYCSIFPREHKFNKDKLLKLWIGSGLIAEVSDTKRSLEDVGQLYINMLVRRSFLDKIVEKDICAEYQEYYVVPSSMHELALHLSLGECARTDIDELQHVKESVRHLSIAQHRLFTPEKLKVLSCLKHLRTLIIEGGLRDEKAENILGKILKGLKCLRVLILPRTSSSSFLDEIVNLVHLRYISFFKCGKSDLCNVFNLYHLKVLKICHLVAETTDFEDIIKLQHLRYLDIPGDCYPKVTQIGKLSELQELQYFVIKKKEGCGLSALNNLSDIKHLGLHEMENIVDPLDVAKFKLSHKTQLKSLSFHVIALTGTHNVSVQRNPAPHRPIQKS